MTDDFAGLLQRLSEAGVEFIVVGGVAGILHGSARLTYDVDVVYARDAENLNRLVGALRDLNPRLRGAPAGLPFRFDVETLSAGLNFTLTTSWGDLDLLGEVSGGGGYAELLSHSVEIDGFGVRFRCVTLRMLIVLKRAAGRRKDTEAIAELEALLEETERDG